MRACIRPAAARARVVPPPLGDAGGVGNQEERPFLLCLDNAHGNRFLLREEIKREQMEGVRCRGIRSS